MEVRSCRHTGHKKPSNTFSDELPTPTFAIPSQNLQSSGVLTDTQNLTIYMKILNENLWEIYR